MKTVASFIAGVTVALAGSAYMNQEPEPPKDNAELAKMYQEDQADRMPKDGKIDWAVVGPRDQARLKRVKEMYQQGLMKTGNDFYNGAMILQHGHVPNDFLLAHELCVVSVSLGNKKALWLAAASEDRFLRNLKRPQRFATQYSGSLNGPVKLDEVDGELTDSHRKLMNCPTLEEAKKREEMFNKPPSDDKKSTGGDGGRS